MKSLKVQDDVWQAAKIQAAKDCTSLSKFTEKALWLHIGRNVTSSTKTGNKDAKQ